MGKQIIRLQNISKQYGDNCVVKDMNMEIGEGEFLTILGPSGCGKTTTLRMIAGFEKPSSGHLFFDEKEIQETEPYHREINTVFQNYALFPHMTVYDNIAFGLKVKRTSNAEIKENVAKMLELVQLEGYGSRRPSQLSGGQKQRVAIARALVNKPKVLLLDEPLGALDLKLRKQMQFELKSLQSKLGITFIYVTHDQEEALTMSDRIAVLSDGILEQLGTPKDIYECPKSKFVADFIGESNIFEGIVSSVQDSSIQVKIESGFISGLSTNCREGDIVDVSVRPENLKISPEPAEGFDCPGIIKESIYIGNINKIIVTLPNGKEAKINQSPKLPVFPAGTAVFLSWKGEDAVVISSPDNQVVSVISHPVFVGTKDDN
ncbi:MAG: ABC transporter ATP-binding protein [Treponema sp.]|jgi:spermidine/putrescine transport system ATP-binding protein|nr:ABC transporter ATP-binding protein [Treponema sp.]